MLGDGGPSPAARRTRRTLTIGLLCAAAVMVPSLTAQAQTPPSDPTTTTTVEPPPPSDPTTTTAPPPPPTEPPPTAPPPTAPPETVPPPPAPAPEPQAEDRGPLPLGGCAISTVVRLNTRSNDVVCVERVLGGLGYQFAGPDELFGLDSWYSLKDFQRRNGLRADGILGPVTGRKMGIWGTATPVAAAPAPTAPTYDGDVSALPLGGCAISTVIRLNIRNADVICVERVLYGLGYQFAGPDELFGLDSWYSLKDFQRNNGLRADGILGPVTGRKMGIWGTATPVAAAPAPEAPVPAPAGEYGLPANSGSGRRVVYDRRQQRIWAVEADGSVVKTHYVSGRTYEPYAGTYSVYSRSMYTYSTADPAVKWRYMVRFAYGPGGGRIGFHEIPLKYGVPLQSERQLGQPLSGGCVRQSTGDAQWMWNWAGVGTKVVVL